MLALIAGQGKLPTALVAALPEKPCIAALEGNSPDDVTPDETFRIERLGSFLTDLTSRGVTEVCFAGAVRRRPIDQSAIDAATMPLVPRITAAMEQGDDTVLRTVVAIFEEAGLAVRGAHELHPGLLPPAGCETRVQVSRDTSEETIRARVFINALASADIGQACVVRHGQCLALEASFGTDWMLESLLSRPDAGGGLLYKAPKPGQDRRVDLPAIGPETVERSKRARLDGIVIEAGGVMVLDQAATVAAADAASMFLWVERVEP